MGRRIKTMKPLPHQEKFLKQNPSKTILNWEMRVGKTLPGALWIDLPEQAGNTYIITIKKNLQEWKDLKTKATVMSKEQFRASWKTIKNPTAIVVDEAHHFASGLFIKGRSQLAEALYMIVKENPDCHILLLTATPIRQNAWSLHTLLCYIGEYYDWKKWRNTFFELVKMPYLRFPAWMPKKDWREKIRVPLEKHCDIIALSEVVKDLPPAKTKIIKIKQKKYKKPNDEIVTWTHEHRYEQTGKIKEILELGYKKVILVCYYTDQINELAKQLKKEKPVFILDGHTKDQAKTIKEAQEADECYFIVQSSCGEGWNGYMFGAMVFVSMSHSCLNHTQMLGRLRHPKFKNPVEVYYLIGGRWDKRIYDTIEKGKDFNPHIYLHEEK